MRRAFEENFKEFAERKMLAENTHSCPGTNVGV
jgi:hypothetical protein